METDYFCDDVLIKVPTAMKLFIFLFLLMPVFLIAQPVPLHDYDVPGAQISAATNYTPDNFRNYIQSGGDVMMEYGLKNLMVQELRFPDSHITVEVFEMGDLRSAYGLYSVSVMKCRAQSLVTAFDCYDGSSYRACQGRFYYHFSSETPGPADRNHFADLAGLLIKNNPDSSILLPSVFNTDLIRRFGKDPFCVKGTLGIQQTPFPWQDLFTMVRATMFAIILPFDRDVYFADVIFQSQADRNTFLKRAGMMDGFNPLVSITTPDGMYREYRQISDTHIYFLECQLPFPISRIAP
jgi:hypothetical protein